MDCVTAPLDQVFPVATEEVNTTLPPAQKLNGPPAEMVGAAGIGFIVTIVTADAREEHPPEEVATE